MNFITYSNAVSLYPNATLLHQRSYFLPMTPKSWQATAAFPPIERDTWTTKMVSLNVHRRPLYTSHQKRELGINVERYMGDQWSWLLGFDGEGCVVESVDAKEHGHLEERLWNTKWVMKFNRTTPRLQPTNVDPNSFGPYMD